MRALITGVTGQDGMILASLLRQRDIEVVGLTKPGSDLTELMQYAPGVLPLVVDLADTDLLRKTVLECAPTHIWNFGGFTAPRESWGSAVEVRKVNVEPVKAIIASIRELNSNTKFFQASSAMVFEGTDLSPQREGTALSPFSPYARSKAQAMEIVGEARSRHGIFACCGVFYNHESPLRGPNFVTRKITIAVANISKGSQKVLELGNTEVARDWGWAPDYVRATMLMLNASVPKDYVLATGISHRLSFFVSRAFAAVGIQNWHDYVLKSNDGTRTCDSTLLVGDSRAAYRDLGWRHTVDFDTLVAKMVRHDIKLLESPASIWNIN